MSSHAVARYNTSFCWKGQKKQAVKQKSGMVVLFLMIVFGFISLNGIIYIFQVNKIATLGYDIRQRENEIEKLGRENKQLEIETAKLRSFYNLESKKQEMAMQKAEIAGIIEIEVEKEVAAK